MTTVLQKLETLPPELRAIITGDEIIDIINQIADDFDIPKTWRAELVRGTIRILSGLMQPGEFIPFIMYEYTMEKDEALQVALAINERIFSAVKPQLASLHNIEDSKLAHKIKVPHKPIEESFAQNIETMLNNTIGATVDETYSQDAMKNSPQNIKYVEPTPQVEIAASKANEPENKPLEGSALVNKLNSMRIDPYRENF